LAGTHRIPAAYAIWSFDLTWQNYLKALLVVVLGSLALSLASQARADSSVIPPEKAEELVRAQLEEQRAIAEALKEEEAVAEAAQAIKPGKAAKRATDRPKGKEAAAAAPAPESGPVKNEGKVSSRAQAGNGNAGKADAEETASLPTESSVRSRSERADASRAGALKPLVAQYASENGVPYELADAVVRLESRYNSSARKGPHMGLTQINVRTAQSLGYKGDAAGLLDAETNLRYGLKYLAVAYKLAGGDICGAIMRYQFGLRTTTMNNASRAYCAKVKVLTAAAD